MASSLDVSVGAYAEVMNTLGLPWRSEAIIRSDFRITDVMYCLIFLLYRKATPWQSCDKRASPVSMRCGREIFSSLLPVFLDSEYIDVVCFTAIDELLDLGRDGNIMANGVVQGSHIVARYFELFVCSLSSYGADRQRSRPINFGPLS